MEKKRLVRSVTDKKLAGVCGGIAKYFDIDPVIVRVVYAILTIFSAAFPGIILFGEAQIKMEVGLQNLISIVFLIFPYPFLTP